jgi:hypothetical protein
MQNEEDFDMSDLGIQVPVKMDLNSSADFIQSKKREQEKISVLSRSEGQLEEDLMDCLNELAAINEDNAPQRE